jgi:hypothetical protein
LKTDRWKGKKRKGKKENGRKREAVDQKAVNKETSCSVTAVLEAEITRKNTRSKRDGSFSRKVPR